MAGHVIVHAQLQHSRNPACPCMMKHRVLSAYEQLSKGFQRYDRFLAVCKFTAQ